MFLFNRYILSPLYSVYVVRAGATTPRTIPSCASASIRGPTVLLIAKDLLWYVIFPFNPFQLLNVPCPARK